MPKAFVHLAALGGWRSRRSAPLLKITCSSKDVVNTFQSIKSRPDVARDVSPAAYRAETRNVHEAVSCQPKFKIRRCTTCEGFINHSEFSVYNIYWQCPFQKHASPTLAEMRVIVSPWLQVKHISIGLVVMISACHSHTPEYRARETGVRFPDREATSFFSPGFLSMILDEWSKQMKYVRTPPTRLLFLVSFSPTASSSMHQFLRAIKRNMSSCCC